MNGERLVLSAFLRSFDAPFSGLLLVLIRLNFSVIQRMVLNEEDKIKRRSTLVVAFNLSRKNDDNGKQFSYVVKEQLVYGEGS